MYSILLDAGAVSLLCCCQDGINVAGDVSSMYHWCITGVSLMYRLFIIDIDARVRVTAFSPDMNPLPCITYNNKARGNQRNCIVPTVYGYEIQPSVDQPRASNDAGRTPLPQSVPRPHGWPFPWNRLLRLNEQEMLRLMHEGEEVQQKQQRQRGGSRGSSSRTAAGAAARGQQQHGATAGQKLHHAAAATDVFAGTRDGKEVCRIDSGIIKSFLRPVMPSKSVSDTRNWTSSWLHSYKSILQRNIVETFQVYFDSVYIVAYVYMVCCVTSRSRLGHSNFNKMVSSWRYTLYISFDSLCMIEIYI